MLITGLDIINLPLIYHVFADFSQKYVLINIHEYANELICILEYQIKVTCLIFNLLPILLLYVEHWLSYD